MDVASVVAAVGSFVVSEKVIKAKATVVFCALGVVAYDLTIVSNDPVLLRVYRGPALLGLAFICTAYSLRTWRRNNCACDELLFLPDTMYYKIAYRQTEGSRNVPLNLRTNLDSSSSLSDKQNRMEDGLTDEDSSSLENETQMIPIATDRTLNLASTSLEDSRLNHPHFMNIGMRSRVKTFICRRKRNQSLDQNATEENNSSSQPKGFMQLFFSKPTLETNEYSPSGPTVASAGLDLLLPVLMNFHLFMMASRSGGRTESTAASSYNISSHPSSSLTIVNTDVGVIYPSHPLQTSDSSNSTSTAFLDNTFEMKQGSTERDFNMNNVPTIPPQVLPIIFLSILLIRSIFPRKGRNRFWKATSSLLRAPFQSVNFRDAFLAEVLTSMTRTLQDFFFGLFYYISTMYGIIFDDLNIMNSGSSLQHNRFLHNFVLPTVALLPLFIRYLQSLRQAYDDQRRWPHLGNASKYLTATLIIVYAMNHAEDYNAESNKQMLSTNNSKPLLRSRLWVLAFIAAMMYQLWWDVVMDWELFEFSLPSETCNTNDSSDGDENDDMESASLLSMRKSSSSSHGILSKMWTYITNGQKLQLRSKRLFKTTNFYWKIFFINSALRFTWMLAFIPAFYVNSETGDIVHTNSVDLGSAVGFALSIAELTRRCLWGVLKVEVETIKMIDPEFKQKSLWNSGKKVDYSCRLFFKTNKAKSTAPPKVPGSKSTRQDVIILEGCKGDEINKEMNLEQMPTTKSYDLMNTPLSFSPEMKTKAAPSALNLISTENMKKTAHRILVRRLFILELSLWAVAYVILALWARYA